MFSSPKPYSLLTLVARKHVRLALCLKQQTSVGVGVLKKGARRVHAAHGIYFSLQAGIWELFGPLMYTIYLHGPLGEYTDLGRRCLYMYIYIYVSTAMYLKLDVLLLVIMQVFIFEHACVGKYTSVSLNPEPKPQTLNLNRKP